MPRRSSVPPPLATIRLPLLGAAGIAAFALLGPQLGITGAQPAPAAPQRVTLQNVATPIAPAAAVAPAAQPVTSETATAMAIVNQARADVIAAQQVMASVAALRAAGNAGAPTGAAGTLQADVCSMGVVGILTHVSNHLQTGATNLQTLPAQAGDPVRLAANTVGDTLGFVENEVQEALDLVTGGCPPNAAAAGPASAPGAPAGANATGAKLPAANLTVAELQRQLEQMLAQLQANA